MIIDPGKLYIKYIFYLTNIIDNNNQKKNSTVGKL
jgi:hypothetical protein